MSEVSLPQQRSEAEDYRAYAEGFRQRMDFLAQAIGQNDRDLVREAEIEVERHMNSHPVLAMMHEHATRGTDQQI